MHFSNLFLAIAATATSLVGAAPLAPILSPTADIIADNFIVVMRDGISTADWLSFLGAQSSDVTSNTKKTYDIGGFKAFAGTFTQSILDVLVTSLDIAYIEPETVVKASALTTQSNAPWGLARISHKSLGSTNYVYDSSAGAGSYAYIIDTGIYPQHVEFEGRAKFLANFAGDGEDFDGNGHGTHCSGTIGSRAYGVAKKIQLFGVKVLDASGSGATSGVIAGIEFAVKDAQANGRIAKSVGSMSLGGIFSRATNDAVKAATSAGLFMAVAAGNDMLPAALFSPASEKTACTVGATDKTDARASYSNYGSVVDIFAPGSEIISTWIDNDTDTNTISGTSMATPHVAGLAAYLLTLEGPRSPAALCQRIKDLSTKNALSGTLGILGTPNQLAYNGNGA